MGMLYQPILCKTVENPNLPVQSVRMARLLNEFLSRYNEWKLAKFQSTLGILIVVFLGLSSLLIPWLLPGIGVPMSFCGLVLLYFSVRYYLEVNERVNHLYVNVHILHHHLLGKLEVGFCDHNEPCQCVDDFRCYVLNNYSVSLSKGSLR
ncbi:hypothetical protein [Desulfosporosinus sp. Sb-LF]|uniref:hypothetical protein n=1 Tax=Desulfosporosinus sp. Sb-LF TaxID=2560027 RepID=UPI00107FAA4B|nr:hypothetical protein [Desulfosporosinus sp. Sb-LF]TGE32285.1 hypothetical protein E4K68_11800 [Desulfosporosinus sp. Sb-LF]